MTGILSKMWEDVKYVALPIDVESLSDSEKNKIENRYKTFAWMDIAGMVGTVAFKALGVISTQAAVISGISSASLFVGGVELIPALVAVPVIAVVGAVVAAAIKDGNFPRINIAYVLNHHIG